MFNRLSFEEFKQLASTHKRVIIYQEYPADILTPIRVFHTFSGKKRERILLESGEREDRVGRFSYLGFDPIASLKLIDHQLYMDKGQEKVGLNGNPFEELRKMLHTFRGVSNHKHLGFVGGAAGYVGYDAIRFIEQIPDSEKTEHGFPSFLFLFFEKGIVFDHKKGIMTLSKIVEVQEGGLEEQYKLALEALQELYHSISQGAPFQKEKKNDPEEMEVDISDEEFQKIVASCKEYIRRGDVFQIVPSRTFTKRTSASPFTLYRALRIHAPAPYMFLIEHENRAIVGASPEKLVSVQNNKVETLPLAGTRKRVPTQDQEIEKELMTNEKESAEHLMLVDLGRNDLGRVCVPGSVHVEKLKFIQKFSHVMHLASIVSGEKLEHIDAIDVLQAVFPAGTLSGAPKIRAMELLDGIERTRRGPYGGAVCMFDAKGDLESCIAIRMAMIEDHQVMVRAGAGIVFDSDPKQEMQETKDKARGMLEAIQFAEEGVL